MDMSSIRDQVSNLTMYDIKAGVRKVQNGKSGSRLSLGRKQREYLFPWVYSFPSNYVCYSLLGLLFVDCCADLLLCLAVMNYTEMEAKVRLVDSYTVNSLWRKDAYSTDCLGPRSYEQ